MPGIIDFSNIASGQKSAARIRDEADIVFHLAFLTMDLLIYICNNVQVHLGNDAELHQF